MKKIAFVTLFTLMSVIVSAQFQIVGKMRIVRPLTLTVEDLDGKVIVQCEIVNGKEFKTQKVSIIDDLYILKIGDHTQYMLFKNNPITLSGFFNDKNTTANSLTIEGVMESSKFSLLSDQLLKNSIVHSPFQEQREFLDKFATENENLDPKVLAAVIYIHRGLITNYEVYKYIYDKQAKNDASLLVRNIKKEITERGHYSLNGKAFNWTFVDKDEKSVSLSDFKGKIVLLDFWASWCGPCRTEMKSLYKIYDEIKGDDLVFVSISLDDDRDKWLDAKKDENIPWVSVWDKAGFWKSEIRMKYGFNQIPFIVLIDKEGRNVVRNLRGENVRSAIEKLRKQ